LQSELRKQAALGIIGACSILLSLAQSLQRVNITTMVMTTQEMIQQIADYFQTQPVLKVWLFGSFSRGEEHEESDVDLLILPDKSQHFSLFTLSGMYEDLRNLIGRDVDLITDGGLMPFARESADRDKILIYERAA
jgi:predicted nucleotidyltransferase